jgi:hypothetical protein
VGWGGGWGGAVGEVFLDVRESGWVILHQGVSIWIAERRLI